VVCYYQGKFLMEKGDRWRELERGEICILWSCRLTETTPIATDLPAASLQESNLRIKDLQLNITKNTAEVTELQTSVSSLPILLSQVASWKLPFIPVWRGSTVLFPTVHSLVYYFWYVVLVLCLNESKQHNAKYNYSFFQLCNLVCCTVCPITVILLCYVHRDKSKSWVDDVSVQPNQVD
jgi:hypothetical protein